MMIETLTMFGPGRNCESESTSRNSASLSQRRRSTIMRRAKGRTPPKPDSPILRKSTKSAEELTEATAGVAAGALHAVDVGDVKPTGQRGAYARVKTRS